ncbi:MAG: hypothetical protein ABEH61_04185 [Haloarculaceae archaeon]
MPTESSMGQPSPPVRGADRNQDLVHQTDPTSDPTLFPTLEEGVTLLDISDGRGVPILQSVVVDHLLLNDGPAFWVDANGHATTTTIARIAPSRRLLNRIHVARGFTAYQHYAAVADLSTAVENHEPSVSTGGGTLNTESTSHAQSPPSPSLIVVPAADARYRDEDSLAKSDSETLQARTLAQLSSYASEYEIPVLITRTATDEFTEPIAAAADQHIECEQTEMGPRFVGDDFETLVYPVEGGTYYQTTFAYWQQLLAARAKHVGIESSEVQPQPSTAANRDGIATTDMDAVGIDTLASTRGTNGGW